LLVIFIVLLLSYWQRW